MSGLPVESVARLAAELRSGRLTAVRVAEIYLDRVERLNPAIAAFVAIDPDQILQDAEACDRSLRDGKDLGSLHGIPVAVKDVIDVRGYPTRANSRVMPATAAKTDAACIIALRQAGAVIFGKTNTWEFCIGGNAPDALFPPVKNPIAASRDPSGSSSGSAAAVAAGMVPVALGTDTGGSIRGPAAWCGIAGFKPTHGLVRAEGCLPLSPTLDHIGALASSSADCAAVVHGAGGRIGGAFDGGTDILKDLRIGVPFHFLDKDLVVAPEVREAFERDLDRLRIAGASVLPVSLPQFGDFADAGAVISRVESYAIHRQSLEEHGREYGRRTLEAILPGAAVSGADYYLALEHRRHLSERVSAALASVDVLVFPTARHGPAELSEDTMLPGRHPFLNRVFNLHGGPALSISAGTVLAGVLSGLQIASEKGRDGLVIAVGSAIEALADGWV